MEKTDFAYAAGLFDGEGNIQIRKYRNKTCKRGCAFNLLVRIANTNPSICNWFKTIFSGSVFSQKPKSGKQRQCWVWCAEANIASEFLEAVFPYLKLKSTEAELALQFQASKKNRYGRKGKSDKQYAIEEEQYLLLQQLHHKSYNYTQ